MADLRALGVTPAILSLEATSAEDVAALLKERYADAVLFAAGAGGKDGVHRTRTVDYAGAVTVCACPDIADRRCTRAAGSRGSSAS